MVSFASLQTLRRKAPQIIAIAIAVAIISYIVFEILEDTMIEGTSLANAPILGTIILLTKNVTATVRSLGYVGIFALMLLESSSLPIPSEVVLPFAGYLVSTGQLGFWLTVIVATLAGIAGSLVDYYIGLKGTKILVQRRILGRSLLSTSQLSIAAGWFSKYGTVIVFFSRMIPGFRTIISFPAGAVKMSLVKFTAYSMAGCLIWNIALIYLGYFLGSNWKKVAGVSHYFIIGAVVVFAVLFVGYLLLRNRSHDRKLASS